MSELKDILLSIYQNHRLEDGRRRHRYDIFDAKKKIRAIGVALKKSCWNFFHHRLEEKAIKISTVQLEIEFFNIHSTVVFHFTTAVSHFRAKCGLFSSTLYCGLEEVCLILGSDPSKTEKTFCKHDYVYKLNSNGSIFSAPPTAQKSTIFFYLPFNFHYRKKVIRERG